MFVKRVYIAIVSFIIMGFTLSCCSANILPQSASEIPKESVGLYQLDKNLKVYSKPDLTSKVVYERSIDYSAIVNIKKDTTLAISVPKKELGYLYVTDVSDDEDWVEVIYDKSELKKGWVLKSDIFQFLPWMNFLNSYGRKYGLIKLTSSDKSVKKIYSNPDDNAQVLGELNRPKSIKLISIEGEWMLTTVLDNSGNIITGYIKWRNDLGQIYLFPNIQ